MARLGFTKNSVINLSAAVLLILIGAITWFCAIPDTAILLTMALLAVALTIHLFRMAADQRHGRL